VTTEPYKPEPFDLKQPPHRVAWQLLRRIEDRNNIKFGPESYADAEMLIKQIRDYFTR
jgi:hypothetical protein